MIFAASIVALSSCKKEDPSIIATEITLNKTTFELLVQSKEQLLASVIPDNTTDKEVVWGTSDATIATVSNTGEVTALKRGSAIIPPHLNLPPLRKQLAP